MSEPVEQPPIEQPAATEPAPEVPAPVEAEAAPAAPAAPEEPVAAPAAPEEPAAEPAAPAAPQEPEAMETDNVEDANIPSRPEPQPYYPPHETQHRPRRHHDDDEGELSTTRLFVRPFPFDVQESELNEIFSPFGPMKEVKILNGFAFVEFEEADAASKAVAEVNGKTFANQPLEVVFSKLPAKRYRLTINNLPEGCSWQDLKDLAREQNLETSFSSVNTRDFDGTGALEFPSEEVLADALEKLNNFEYRGSVITVQRDDNPPPIRRGRGGFRGGRGGFRGGYGGRGGYGRGGYGGPRDSYGPPRGDYGAPRGDYGAPRGDYGAPRGDYGSRDNAPRERSPTR